MSLFARASKRLSLSESEIWRQILLHSPTLLKNMFSGESVESTFGLQESVRIYMKGKLKVVGKVVERTPNSKLRISFLDPEIFVDFAIENLQSGLVLSIESGDFSVCPKIYAATEQALREFILDFAKKD